MRAAQVRLTFSAIASWKKPDNGPWEVRSDGRPFTYSAAICHVALDQAIQIAGRHRLPYPKRRGEAAARQIHGAALGRSWDAERRTFTDQLGGQS
jgi:GH15 family glucan-1,4-alpha-glucosidase